MSDTGATETQADSQAQPQAGTSEAPAADEQEQQSESISLEEAKKLRSEAASLRKRLKAFEESEAKRSDSEKSEAQRAADRLAALEAELNTERSARRSLLVQSTAAATARKLGFKNPDLAQRLISANDVEFGDDGTPTNVERLLADAAKEFPDLVGGTTDFGGGPRGQAAGGQKDMNNFIRRAAGRA